MSDFDKLLDDVNKQAEIMIEENPKKRGRKPAEKKPTKAELKKIENMEKGEKEEKEKPDKDKEKDDLVNILSQYYNSLHCSEFLKQKVTWKYDQEKLRAMSLDKLKSLHQRCLHALTGFSSSLISSQLVLAVGSSVEMIAPRGTMVGYTRLISSDAEIQALMEALCLERLKIGSMPLEGKLCIALGSKAVQTYGINKEVNNIERIQKELAQKNNMEHVSES